MNRTERIIDLFKMRFIHRYDCFPEQYKNNGGGYILRKEKLTDQIILSHLKGEKTIGLYGSQQSTTKWLCIDIDTLEEGIVREVQNHVRRLQIPYLTEFSGQKGYHIWVFFDKLYPNKIARALAGVFAFNNEVFPKQDYIESGKHGNLIKAPLGKHQVPGKWCIFLDNELKPENDQYGTLNKIKTINPIQILKNNIPETWKNLNFLQPEHDKSLNQIAVVKLPFIKDCVVKEIHQGTNQGKRNQVGHIIATELRNANLKKEHAGIILQSMWNKRNNPPLKSSELKRILNYAYGEKEYTYGCNKNGLLRELIECNGQDNCLYLTVLKSYRKVK